MPLHQEPVCPGNLWMVSSRETALGVGGCTNAPIVMQFVLQPATRNPETSIVPEFFPSNARQHQAGESNRYATWFF
jgi:hypothetical protein